MDRAYKRRKTKRTLHPFRTIFFLLILAVVAYIGHEYAVNGNLNNVVQVFSKISLKKTNLEESSYSSNNSIEGQKLVENQDGYTTTFTTLSPEHQKTYKEYKQNMDSASWTDKSYWGGTMRKNGCGITAMAIIASGYDKNITPEDLRQKYYPHLNGDDMASAFKKMEIKCTDFYYHDSYLTKKYITDWLYTSRPVIICVNSQKKNIWTENSHYMVLLDINSEGFVYLSNPNGLDGTSTASRLVQYKRYFTIRCKSSIYRELLN